VRPFPGPELQFRLEILKPLTIVRILDPLKFSFQLIDRPCQISPLHSRAFLQMQHIRAGIALLSRKPDLHACKPGRAGIPIRAWNRTISIDEDRSIVDRTATTYSAMVVLTSWSSHRC